MQFVVQYIDRADSGGLRAAHREAHIAYRKSLGPKLLLAGPLLSEQSVPVGSLVMFEAESLAAARQMARADPYAAAGVFREISVYGYRIMANRLSVGS